jgi:hypothetical protein
MYQHAARHLPATADLFAYANDRVQTAAFWAQIRQAAQQTGDGQDQPARQMSMNPMMSLVEQTRDYVDYSKLPPFERVEKHFGASVSYLKGTEDGLLMESFSVQPAE